MIRGLVGYQSVSFALLFLVSILAIFYGTGPILLAAVLSAVIWMYSLFLTVYLHIENPLMY
jgi:hypothetical protein